MCTVTFRGSKGGEGGREGEISNVCTLYGVFVYNNSVDGGGGGGMSGRVLCAISNLEGGRRGEILNICTLCEGWGGGCQWDTVVYNII